MCPSGSATTPQATSIISYPPFKSIRGYSCKKLQPSQRDTSHPDCRQSTLLTDLFGGPAALQNEIFSKNRPAYSRYNSRGQKSLAIKQTSWCILPLLFLLFSSSPCTKEEATDTNGVCSSFKAPSSAFSAPVHLMFPIAMPLALLWQPSTMVKLVYPKYLG